MRRFWINSIPLLVVLFTLIFGFTVASIAANCDDLEEAMNNANATATIICTVFGNANALCIDATAVAGAATFEFYNAGCQQ